MTAQGAVRLALKTKRPLLPMAVTRDKSNFTVSFYPPLALEYYASPPTFYPLVFSPPVLTP